MVILHGYGGAPKDNRLPQAQKELKKLGFDVHTPALPDPDKVNIDEKVNFLLKK